MATGDGPSLKKVKVQDDYDDIFMSFHKNHLECLEIALGTINGRASGYGVGVLKIKNCDAQSSKCFSNATCDCQELRTPSSDGSTSTVPEGFHINGIFQYGFDMLEAYIKCPQYTPRRKGARQALANLLNVLSNRESLEKTLSHGLKGTNETEWAATVAHHLLSKLAVGSTYILDNISKGKGRVLGCPCGCGEKLSGSYGDTSIGVPSYWHGRVDIMMDAAVTLATEESDSPGAENSSSIEMKSSSDRMVECKEKIRAETIVFSFWQKKKHPDLNNFLIPTVAISKSQVAICMYDSENDIFLETPRLDFFLEGIYLKVETIITLWLVLNFRYCCSGVPEEIMETGFKADFFKHTGELLERYSADVIAPCNYQSEKRWLALKVLKNIKKKVNNVNDIYQPPNGPLV